MPVRIICDSAAALPDDLVAELGITVVPMVVEVGTRSLSEGEMPLDELVRRLDEGVKTSGPSPGAFLEAVEAADREGGSDLVVMTVARRYSSTFDAALNASKLASEERSGRVEVIDTGSAAGGEGLIVLAAARAAAAGADLDAVTGQVERVRARVRLIAAVEHLEYLVKGGRLPASMARLGQRLGIHVLFELRASGPRPARPALSDGGAMDNIVNAWRHSRPDGASLHVAALHALRPEEAEKLLAAVSAEVEPATAYVGSFGPVMVAHTGPGLVGLSWWWE